MISKEQKDELYAVVKKKILDARAEIKELEASTFQGPIRDIMRYSLRVDGILSKLSIEAPQAAFDLFPPTSGTITCFECRFHHPDPMCGSQVKMFSVPPQLHWKVRMFGEMLQIVDISLDAEKGNTLDIYLSPI